MFRLKKWIDELRSEVAINKETFERSINETNERLSKLIGELDKLIKKIDTIEKKNAKSRKVKQKSK